MYWKVKLQKKTSKILHNLSKLPGKSSSQIDPKYICSMKICFLLTLVISSLTIFFNPSGAMFEEIDPDIIDYN